MSELLQQVKLRQVNPEKDVNFILSTWLKSYRQSEFARDIINDIYFPFHQTLITQILQNPSNNITMLCDPDDPEHVIGYIVYSIKDPIVYYMYVKYNFRKLGFGKHLFNSFRSHFEKELDKKDLAIHCTHKCRRWSKAAKKHNLIYNPYIVGE